MGKHTAEMDRPCHYVKGPVRDVPGGPVRQGRILIPGCWGTVHTLDMRSCYCYRPEKLTAKEEIAMLAKRVRDLRAMLDRMGRAVHAGGER